VPGADTFEERAGVGVHYHKNYLTPYWDPEAGIALDISYQCGVPVFGTNEGFQQVYGQVAFVKRTPQLECLGSGPVRDWLRGTRWAFRLGGAGAVPLEGQFFSLGGAESFRGFDLSERQGSLVWVGSVEARIPIVKDVCWDFCDHVGSLRNIYLAPFYDVGDALVNHQSYGAVAHAVGVGLRFDVAWLGLIERTMFRVDAAKTINADTPWQFWVGVQHPF
jgi:outer membrane translocation and assembly module TamA